MILSMEQTKVFHKDMWLEIEAIIRTRQKCVSICKEKEVFIRSILPKYIRLYNDCFLCDYAFQIKAEIEILDNNVCFYCPARESQSSDKTCLNGLFDKCVETKDWKEQADLAHQIACICD